MLKASVVACTIVAAAACGSGSGQQAATGSAQPTSVQPSDLPSAIPTALPSGTSEKSQRQFEKLRGWLVNRIVKTYEFAGATPEEAECIAEELLANVHALRVYGTTEEKARKTARLLKEHASSCASQARLAQLGRAAMVAPYEQALSQAGASPKEIGCFLEKVEELDLFFPSEDFNGKQAARMGIAQISKDVDGCLSRQRVRAIVTRVFAEYEEGCTRSSDDPLAPFEC